MNIRVLVFGALLTATPLTYAKTSWNVSVGVPITSQQTTTYTVQHIPPSATVGQYTYTTVDTLPNQAISPPRYNTSNKPALYAPPVIYPYSNKAPLYAPPVVYSYQAPVTQIITQTQSNGSAYAPQTTTIVQQTHYPTQAVFNLRVGDVVPVNYRQVNYWVNDWQRYQLSAPPAGYLWINVGNGQFALVSQPDYTISRIER